MNRLTSHKQSAAPRLATSSTLPIRPSTALNIPSHLPNTLLHSSSSPLPQPLTPATNIRILRAQIPGKYIPSPPSPLPRPSFPGVGNRLSSDDAIDSSRCRNTESSPPPRDDVNSLCMSRSSIHTLMTRSENSQVRRRGKSVPFTSGRIMQPGGMHLRRTGIAVDNTPRSRHDFNAALFAGITLNLASVSSAYSRYGCSVGLVGGGVCRPWIHLAKRILMRYYSV